MTVTLQENSFTGTTQKVGNMGCRSVIDMIMSFRTQITRGRQIKVPGGWSHAFNEYLAVNLGNIRKQLAVVTYEAAPTKDEGESSTSSSKGQKSLEKKRKAEAIDENTTLLQLFGSSAPLTNDDIVMPTGFQSSLPYDFSGEDPNFPQLNDPKYQNGHIQQFVCVMDMAVRDCSNLSDAPHGYSISPLNSVVVLNHLQTAFTILQLHGGYDLAPFVPNATNPESLTGKVGPEIKAAKTIKPVDEAIDAAVGKDDAPE